MRLRGRRSGTSAALCLALLTACSAHAGLPTGFRVGTIVSLGHAPVALAVGDLNGDGKPDVVLVHDADSVVTTLLGDGAGGLHAQRDLLVRPGLLDVALARLDGDARLDAVVSGS